MWESFKGQLIRVQDQHVPLKMEDKDNKIQEPWMTRDIQSLVKNKEAYVRLRKLRSNEAIEEYKESSKEIKKKLPGLEGALTSKIKENRKAFYKYTRSKREARKKVGPLKHKWNLCVEPKEVGEILNEYFASVFTTQRDIDDATDKVPEEWRTANVVPLFKKGNKVIREILGYSTTSLGIECKCWQVMLQLYKTSGRPHLEYCAQFWSLHDRKDVEALEK
eukprot:g47418.t1